METGISEHACCQQVKFVVSNMDKQLVLQSNVADFHALNMLLRTTSSYAVDTIC